MYFLKISWHRIQGQEHCQFIKKEEMSIHAHPCYKQKSNLDGQITNKQPY
jgi:hypothetical protein